MLLDVILIVLLLMVLGGYGWSWRDGGLSPASPLGILLVILIVFLIAGLIVPRVWLGYS